MSTLVVDLTWVGLVCITAVGGTESTINVFHSPFKTWGGVWSGYVEAKDSTPSDGSEDVHDKGCSTGIPVEDRVV